MAYTFEQYGVLRQEVQKGSAATIYHWPKEHGTGNLDITSATYVIKSPDGATTIEVSQSADLTAINSIERIDCDIAAISTADEGYRCEISWVYSGKTYVEVVLFDVLSFPYDAASISLNDLQEERPDIEWVCERLGELLNSKTAAQVASIFGFRARVRLNRLIRERIDLDRRENVGSYDTHLVNKVYSRASAIINKEALNRLERVIALMLIYQASTRDPDEGDDENAGLFRMYRAEMDNELKSLHLEYDVDGDGIPDKTIQSGPRVMHFRRSQA